MSDEHRFQLTAKLCQDVLAAVVDGTIPFVPDANPLLQDTLAVLSSKVRRPTNWAKSGIDCVDI